MNQYQFFAKKKVSPLAQAIARKLHKKLFSLFKSHFSSSADSVLEIGPGQGAFTELLITIPSIRYKGYEPETLLCRNLENKGLTVTQTVVPPIPEKDNQFGGIVILNVLEHMKGICAAQQLASEMFRTLAPQGIVFLSVPSFLDWRTDFFNLDYTHDFVTTELNVSQLLTDAGFTVEYVGYSYGCFLSDVGRIFNFSAKLARWLLMTFLPRKSGRREKIQKLGVLFAENILIIARKK
jgi:SAM-dependent methyltransferase